MTDLTERATLLDAALSATRAREWEQALLAWEQVRAQFPNEVIGWSRGGEALRHLRRFEAADAMLAEAIDRFPGHPEPAEIYAACAQDQQDWELADRRWRLVRERFPANHTAWHQNAAVLRQAGRSEALEALLEDAVIHFPADAQLAIEFATLPQLRRAFHESLGRLRALRSRFTDTPAVLRAEADLLRHHLDDGDGAEAVLVQAMERFPEAEAAYIDYAWTAEQFRRGPEETLRRWRLAHARFPELPAVIHGLCFALDVNGEHDEADRVRLDGLARFPDSLELATQHTLASARRGDADETLARWDDIVARMPNRSFGIVGKAAALRGTGRLDEAEAMLADGMRRFPHDPEAFFNHAYIATMRRDWPEALRRLLAARERFPNHALIAARISETRLQLDLAHVESGEAVPTQAVATPADDKELLMRFESLGNDCTFGFVQRAYAAEPIGLLRWAGLTSPNLTRALRDGLEGVGNPENTVIVADPLAGAFGEREYMARDARYSIYLHTGVPVGGTVDIGALGDRVCRRLRFMRNKLLADLAEAEKIFLYKDDSDLPEEQIDQMLAALRDYGPNTLLYVRPEDGMHPAGTVEYADEGLIQGYLHRPAVRSYAGAEAAWLDICRRAYALWQMRKAAMGLSEARAGQYDGADSSAVPEQPPPRIAEGIRRDVRADSTPGGGFRIGVPAPGMD